MPCHRCKVTGVVTCDPQEAEIKCMICGFCERQEIYKQFGYPSDGEKKLQEDLNDGYKHY